MTTMPTNPHPTLIFGHMPKTATPKTHKAAGAWCFAGQEELFPLWWDCKNTDGYFPLPDDPFATAKEIEDIAAQNNAEILRLLPSLSQHLNTFHKKEYSAQFWELALGPWLLLITHVLSERQKRVADLVQLYGKEQLFIPIIPNTTWEFTNSLDFIERGVLTTTFNHFVYSRILEKIAPPTWHLIPLTQQIRMETSASGITAQSAVNTDSTVSRQNAVNTDRAVNTDSTVNTHNSVNTDGAVNTDSTANTHNSVNTDGAVNTDSATISDTSRGIPATKSFSLLKGIKNQLSYILQSMPFPRLKGFPFWMSCLLSLKVMQHKTPRNHSHSLTNFATTPVNWAFDAPSLIQSLLPKDFYAPLPSIPNATNKLQGMVPAFSQNEKYRLRMAAWQAGGGKLFCVQHGANYGNLSCVGISIFEYMQHAFFSWGFTQHAPYPVNAIPTIHPILATLYNTHKTATPNLILVGAEMSTHAYRLKTRPFAKKLVQYRQAKILFLDALPQNIQAQVVYRPYCKSCSSLRDYSFIQNTFPNIQRCTGDLTQHMLQSTLTVLDHYGTTLHTSLAANTPTVCFWVPTDWGMNTATLEVLHHLQEAQIFHPTPQHAAAHIQKIWADVPTWWHSPKVQLARTLWLQHFALCFDATHTPLTNWQLFRHWSKAIATCP